MKLKLFLLLGLLMMYFTAENKQRITTFSEVKNWSDAEKMKYVRQRASFWLSQFACNCTDYAYTNAIQFFTDDRLNVLETALIEELKFGIPAEVKLAQAIVETGWGKNVKGNNWFGIKGKGQKFITSEYLTKEQMSGLKIIRSNKVDENLYFCIIEDSFEAYETSWESWRNHSHYLMNAKNGSKYRYNDLLGRHWKVWVDSLAERGYATDITYGQKLQSIIIKYKLYRL